MDGRVRAAGSVEMASAYSKRANLMASKLQWRRICEQLGPSSRAGEPHQDSIHQWLISGCQEDSQTNISVDPAESLRRHGSTEDDLVLGVEASLYGRQTPHRTAEGRHRPLHLSPALPRGISFTSTASAISECRSVMDVLNLWHDDPEELLLDLGFGSDEPDIAVKIPSRFINHPSQARGINIQVFLEAQKNRIDVENPDISNRFRQLEVLHQVATAFSSLVGSPPGSQAVAERPVAGQPVAGQPVAGQTHVDRPEASERRRRLAMLLRRASRKTINQSAAENIPQRDPSPEPRLESRSEPRPTLKRSRQLLRPSEASALSPLAEEQMPLPDPSQPKLDPTTSVQEAPLRTHLGRDAIPTASTDITRKRSPADGREPESFELEEIQSFDDTSVAVTVTGQAYGTELGVVRTNSCQSDSSGFLEEPVIPPRCQRGAAAPELMTATAVDDTKIRGPQEGCQDPSSPAPLANLDGDSSTEGLETSPGPGAAWTDGDAKVELSREEEAPTLMVDYIVTSSTNEGNMGGALEDGGVAISSENRCRGEGSNFGESMATLLRDSADSDELTYVSSVEDMSTLDQGAEPRGLRSFMEYAGSEEPSSGGVQGLPETPPASSLPGSRQEQSHPTLMEDAGCGGGRPSCWISVQMPFGLSSVSQTISGRATPPTPTPGLVHGRMWGDQEVPPDIPRDPPSDPPLDLPTDFSSSSPQQGTRTSEGGFHTRSTSLDTGLAYEEDDDEEEMESGPWKGETGVCCCRCHHRCSCCPPQALHRHCSRQHPDTSTREMRRASSISSTFPYSMDELDEMMRSSHTFRLVLADIERRLGEEQASLCSGLSEEDREDIRAIQELRAAVRKEAMELEGQLAELAHHYDQGFKTKMHRLLDEQSYLCAQLRLRPPEAQLWSAAPMASLAPRLSTALSVRTRTVATQCSLPPWPPLVGVSTQEGVQVLPHAIDTPQPGADEILGGKQNKLDFVAFLQSLKEPLRRSVTRDTLK